MISDMISIIFFQFNDNVIVQNSDEYTNYTIYTYTYVLIDNVYIAWKMENQI